VAADAHVASIRTYLQNSLKQNGFCAGSLIDRRIKHEIAPVFLTEAYGEVKIQFESTVIFTESQDGWGWKGPLWVIQSNPLPKQGHLQQAAQDLVFLHNIKDPTWVQREQFF